MPVPTPRIGVTKYGLSGSSFSTPEVQAYAGERIDRYINDVETLLAETAQSSAKIGGDRGLTGEGKLMARTALGNKARKQLDEFTDKRRAMFSKELADAEKAVPTGPFWRNYIRTENLDQDAFFTKMVELRAFLLAANPVLRYSVVSESIDAGEVEPLLSVITASSVMQLIEPDKVRELSGKYLRLTAPDTFAAVDTISQTLVIIETNFNAARTVIGQIVGVKLDTELPLQAKLDRDSQDIKNFATAV